jgi:plastocyanin
MGSAKRKRVVAGAFAVVLVFAACGGDEGDGGGDGTTDATGTTGATGATAGTGATGETGAVGGTSITIEGFAFSPSTLQVEPGPFTLTVTNNDGVTHTLTTDTPLIDVTIDGGETVEVEAEAEGSISIGYHCSIHPQMTGTIQVG